MLLQLAWRNIWRNKMRSIVVIASIAVGLFAGIAVLSLYKGMMTNRIRTVIDSEIGHLQIHARHFTQEKEIEMMIPNGDFLLSEVEKFPLVRSAAPRLIALGMLSTTSGSAGVQINGVEAEKEQQVSHLNEKIVSGNYFTEKKNEILIGKKLADKLKIHVGSKIVLTFTDTANNLVSGAFKIRGIYQTFNAPLDEANVYVKKETLSGLLGLQHCIHEIAIILQSDEAVENTLLPLQQQYPSLDVADWRALSPETNLLVRTVDDYSYVIIIIILFALAFGITNTMLMAVLERRREMGMLMALGTSRIRISGLILMETILLTLAGTPVGLFLGWMGVRYFHRTGLDFSSSGEELMASFGFSTRLYPEFPNEKLLPVLLIVCVTALLSAIIPLIKTLTLKPAEALRM
ncbi:MAG: ABC transporter permease [Bacteroidetes bacterium]|nr:ABC transporter permease [Bacteroidota bacterium]